MHTVGKPQGDLLEHIVEKTYGLLQFPKSPSARREFCTNLAIVALGIRAGYLVDSFSPNDGIHGLQRLLTILRLESSHFDDVRLVHAAEHDQYFFINLPLMRERGRFSCCEDAYLNDSERPMTTFVLLDRVETIIGPPPDVIQSIQSITESTEDPIQIPECLTVETLIPLTGFLLEFPITYIPSSADSSIFLSGIPLYVYECTITANQNDGKPIAKDHTLLKFSCPAHPGVSFGALAPRRIVKDLEDLFRSRLRKASCPWYLRVSHSVVTQDRVAL